MAVETTEGPVLVLSGAGTGKTRVLTARIAYILSRELARPWEILALTFTNKAAGEIKDRLQNEFNIGTPPAWVGTFHRICLKILKQEEYGDFVIYDEDDQKKVIKNIIKELGLNADIYKPSDWVEKISYYKDSGKKHGDINFDKILENYNKELARLNALDFGDIILKTIELLEKNPNVLKKYQDQFKYILVDEYQDTNIAQIKLLNIFIGENENPNFCVVGDDDQSIYSWRGAEIKHIMEFPKKFKSRKIIKLEINYRSTDNILGAANSLIKHNEKPLELKKEMKGIMGPGQKIAVIDCPTGYEEARIIVKIIKDLGQKEYNNCAVFLRNASLSRVFEEVFMKNDLPFKLIGLQKFYDREEVKDVIAYIRMLLFPFDDISFERIIKKPRRGFGDKAISELKAFARLNNLSLFGALEKFPMKDAGAKKAVEFLNAFNVGSKNDEPLDVVRDLLEKTGYMQMWKDSGDANKDERIRNIGELLSTVKSHDTLEEFIDHISLMTADENTTDGDGVIIRTIHSAKGWETDFVFLPAWEEEIFPNNQSDLEEERRLAYVAITRAKKMCFILNSASRLLFGKWNNNTPSRFIGEIDERFLYFPNRMNRNIPVAPPVRNKSKVGQLIDTEWGKAVVIEDNGDHYIVASKTGIKKILL